MTEIKHYKLISGEEIIGKFSDVRDDNIFLTSVYLILAHPTSTGQLGYAMIPWLIASPDAEVKIPVVHILGEPENALPKEIEDYYLQQTSRIALSTNGR